MMGCRIFRPAAAVLVLTLLPMRPWAPAGQAAEAAASGGWSADPPSLSALAAHARTQSDLRTAVKRYFADKAALERRYPVRNSPVRFARLRKFHQGWLDQLSGMAFDGLNREGKVDYILLRRRIERDLRELGRTEEHAAALAPLVPFGDEIRLLEEARLDRRRAGARKSAEIVHAIAEQAKQMEASLSADMVIAERATGETGGSAETAEEVQAEPDSGGDAPRLSPADVRRAAHYVSHLREMLGNWYRAYEDFDPLFTWWVRKPYETADEALGEYRDALSYLAAEFLPEGVGSASALPVGAEGLREALAAEMIPYTPEELLAIGEREFLWTEDQLKRVAREMGFGDDWKAALEHTKAQARPPGSAPWMYYDIAEYAENFVERLGVIDLPPLAREVWRIGLQPSSLQSMFPYATGGEESTVAYAAGDMEHGEKLKSMRGNSQHFSVPVMPHEVLPGHHLEQFVSRRFNGHRGTLSRTPFYTEGWGFYWELFLWDAGYARSAPERVGMLFWRRHRAGRILFSLNYQLGNWSREECVDFLVDRVGHERANAEAEVRRTVEWPPLYQAAYMVGALQLRALYRELVDGGKMSAREFHNRVLTGGPMPIEMIRTRLSGEKLTPDYESRWRFYEGLEGN